MTLELKIPPVPLMLAFAILMWFLSAIFPDIDIPNVIQKSIALIVVGIALFFAFAGVYSFRKAKTTVDPRKPNTTSSLVTSGIYRWTRNPMYVGFLFVLLAWGIYLSNLWSLVLSIGYVFYMNRFQIQPEEKVLEKLFGKEYLRYKQQARRWL